MDGNRPAGQAPENTLVRDRLALIRTQLANERTFLAYLRSSLALFFTGVTSLHYLGSPADVMLGVTLIVTGTASLAFGVVRLVRFRRSIEREGRA